MLDGGWNTKIMAEVARYGVFIRRRNTKSSKIMSISLLRNRRIFRKDKKVGQVMPLDGWIKLYREIVQKDIYVQPPIYLKTFERMVIEANRRCQRIPYNKTTKLVRRGEKLTSIRQIAEWVGWYERGIFKIPNPKTVSEILDWLIKKQMIEIYNRGNSQETHYNIVNYCIYQSRESDESNAKVTANGEVSKQQTDTNKKIKKDKNIKNKDLKDIMPGAINPPCQNPPFINLILNDKSEYPIYQGQVDQWKDLYQSVNIIQELKKMKGWLDANPTKRKTKAGILRFINSWLSKEQDKSGFTTATNPKETAYEKAKREADEMLRKEGIDLG